VRQHEAHRPDDVRRCPQQHLALDQRFADQTEFVIFKIPQAAMDQLSGARTGALRKVILLAQYDAEAPAGGVAGDTRAIDAAADDEKIDEIGLHQPCTAFLTGSAAASCKP
jgi:hypothetical protein